MKAVLRPACAEDAAAICRIYAPYVENTPVTFEEVVPAEAEMADRIRKIGSQLPFLVCENEERVVGYTYAADHRSRAAYRWTKEASVYVDPQFRNRRIGQALYTALATLLAAQGVTMLLAGITLPNPESVGFHENFGFLKIAEYHAVGYKLEKWHNVGWWELNLNPGLLPPRNTLVPFGEIESAVLQNAFRVANQMILL